MSSMGNGAILNRLAAVQANQVDPSVPPSVAAAQAVFNSLGQNSSAGFVSPMANKSVGASNLAPTMTTDTNGQPATLLQSLQQQGVSRSGY